jgi:hypothetical protein
VLALVVLLLACTVVLMVRRGRKKVALLHKHTALVSSSTKPGVTINMKDLKMNMALSTPIINNGLARSRVVAAKSKVQWRQWVKETERECFRLLRENLCSIFEKISKINCLRFYSLYCFALKYKSIIYNASQM